MFPKNLELLRCPACAAELAALPVKHSPEGELLEALLTCRGCGRWYRCEDGLPDLVRDGLREVEQDRAWLERHRGRLRPALLERGSPFGLEGPVPQRTDGDQRIVDEGRHWGRFMQHFWDAGDRAIFDLRFRGSHPSFLVAGVLEADDRDGEHRWGNFSRRAGDLMFRGLEDLAGRRGLDVGCGGGQFGLEAARQGVQMFSFDPSFQEAQLGRRHAREQGILNIEYLRGEPAHPPFASGRFDLLMAKDALHHVPDLEAVWPRLAALLTGPRLVILHEHAAKAPRKEAFMNRLRGPLIEKIQRRYPRVEIPEELARDSANEDVSMHTIRPLLERAGVEFARTEDLYLANELELLVHYAYGKRRWLSRPAYWAGWLLEQAFLLAGEQQHLTWVGRARCAGAGNSLGMDQPLREA